MYKTKMVLEVEVETQLGPQSAVDIVSSLLKHVTVPAITNVTLQNLKTDYSLRTSKDANQHVMSGFPITIK